MLRLALRRCCVRSYVVWPTTIYGHAGHSEDGTIEVDETYLGGKRRNIHNAQRKQLEGRGPNGKTAVVGAVERKGTIKATLVRSTSSQSLGGFVEGCVEKGASVYTDDPPAYNVIDSKYRHESVNHTQKEYLRGDVHTNSIESFWSLFKRGYCGTFYKLSPKQMHRYANEFAGRHNIRDLDTIEQLKAMARAADDKVLRCRDLIADNGLSIGAREIAAQGVASFPAEGLPTGQFCPPPLQGRYTLTTTVGSSNAMQPDETHGCLTSIQSGGAPPTA